MRHGVALLLQHHAALVLGDGGHLGLGLIVADLLLRGVALLRELGLALLLQSGVALLVAGGAALRVEDGAAVLVLHGGAALLRLVPTLGLWHCDGLGHLDSVALGLSLLVALLLLHHGALLPRNKVHLAVRDSAALTVRDGAAFRLKDGAGDWLLDSGADGPWLVPALVLLHRLAGYTSLGGHHSHRQQQQYLHNKI